MDCGSLRSELKDERCFGEVVLAPTNIGPNFSPNAHGFLVRLRRVCCPGQPHMRLTFPSLNVASPGALSHTALQQPS